MTVAEGEIDEWKLGIPRSTIHSRVEENDCGLLLERRQAPIGGRVPFEASQAPGGGRLQMILPAE